MKDISEDIRIRTLHMTLIRLTKTHRRKAHAEFSKVGITEGQPKILDFLSVNDGSIQREIANSCNIEPATVTSLLSIMEKAELIYKNQDPKDKRVLKVFLTEKGKMAQKEVEKIFNQIDMECFEGFSEEEKDQTITVLNRLYENMLKRG
jgi:DNA-binding MarR family transcriptional regulator